MVMIWSGFGFLVPLILMGTVFGMEKLFEVLFGETYYREHLWPTVFVSIIAGVIIGAVGIWLNRVRPANKPNAVPGAHRLFFIPMEYWGFIVPVFISVCVLVDQYKPS